MLILGAVLAACTPEGQAQETKPAVTQTIDDLDSIPTVTNTVEILKTNTPENTPTVTATVTAENTPTPKAPEFPTNLEFDFTQQILVPLYTGEWGLYETRNIYAVKIRPEDIHYEEFTLLTLLKKPEH